MALQTPQFWINQILSRLISSFCLISNLNQFLSQKLQISFKMDQISVYLYYFSWTCTFPCLEAKNPFFVAVASHQKRLPFHQFSPGNWSLILHLNLCWCKLQTGLSGNLWIFSGLFGLMSGIWITTENEKNIIKLGHFCIFYTKL